QVVNRIGSGAVTQLSLAYQPTQEAITVSVEISKLVAAVGDAAGKGQATTRLIAVTRQVAGVPGQPDVVRPIAIDLLRKGGRPTDRLGETRDPAAIAPILTIFDNTNGGTANDEYTLRWKAGEAVLKLGGASFIPTFAQHLTATRPAAFTGYTFAEINGEASA